MMQDSHYLNGITSDPVQDPMTVADEAAYIGSEGRPSFAAVRKQCKAFKGMIDSVLIRVGG